MTEVAERSQIRLSSKRTHGRMANVMADLLRRQLYVPNIFVSPKIAGAPAINVLAVDRAGSGDLHGVEIKITSIFPTRLMLRALLKSLKSLPVHYKYLALPAFSDDLSDARRSAEYAELFDESGVGRVGIISFDHRVLNDAAAIDATSAVLIVRPERFLVRGEKLSAIERFLSKTKPDMEVRL